MISKKIIRGNHDARDGGVFFIGHLLDFIQDDGVPWEPQAGAIGIPSHRPRLIRDHNFVLQSQARELEIECGREVGRPVRRAGLAAEALSDATGETHDQGACA